jgi:hypothetical protein
MGRRGVRIATMLALVAASLVGWGWARNHRIETAFASTSVGDEERVVVDRFGGPSHVEPSNKPWARYAASRCAGCVRRLWWESSFLPGIEAWSVEIGPDARVMETAHWVSP